MGRQFKFHPGDQVGPGNILMISRDYNTGHGNWYGTFKCPLCGQHFQAKIKSVSSGRTSSCGCKSNKLNILGEINSLNYEIIGEINKPNSRNAHWQCICHNCNTEFEITTVDFHREIHKCPVCATQSVGRKPQNLIGKRFGKLIVLEYCGGRKWKCQCDCGRISYHRTDTLLEGHVISCGCVSSKGEMLIGQILQELNIEYIPQKTFHTCRFPDSNALARFDFYIPSLNILIEYNGIQHYEYKQSGWNTKENFQSTIKRDSFKWYWCEDNNIKLIIIPYTDINKIDTKYIKELLFN